MDSPEIIRFATYEIKQAKSFPVHVRKPNGGMDIQDVPGGMDKNSGECSLC